MEKVKCQSFHVQQFAQVLETVVLLQNRQRLPSRWAEKRKEKKNRMIRSYFESVLTCRASCLIFFFCCRFFF